MRLHIFTDLWRILYMAILSHFFGQKTNIYGVDHPENLKNSRLQIFTATFLSAFILASCTAQYMPVSVETATSPLDTTNAPLLAPTATNIQLPYDDSMVNREYCEPPDVFLPVSDSQELNEDEIAGKLIDLWLAYFQATEAPGFCRIDDYNIEQVYYDERTPDLPLEPKGDFMRVVNFSIKLVQIPNQWMSWAGEVDQQNWLHISSPVAVFQDAEGYIMEFARP